MSFNAFFQLMNSGRRCLARYRHTFYLRSWWQRQDVVSTALCLFVCLFFVVGGLA